MKRWAVILMVVVMLGVLGACARKHYDATNIHEKYDREWIIGKSREQIERKYGEFRREYTLDSGEDVGAYYVNYENSGFNPSHIHDTYFVVFDDEDIAIDAYFVKSSMGG